MWIGVRSGSHHSQVVPYELRPPTLDEYPVPQGSWQEDYNKKQKRFNIHLAAGVIIFSSTIAFVRMVFSILIHIGNLKKVSSFH